MGGSSRASVPNTRTVEELGATNRPEDGVTARAVAPW